MNRIPGVVTGVVKSLDDPDGQGRIELEFRGLPDAPESGWAPIAVPLAGKSRGMYFMPEKEDEVLVAFERGDFDHPFVIGYLWNGVDSPPETDPENRIIFTPGKHTLRFEDKNQKIILQSAGGHSLVIDDNAKTVTLQSKGGHKITIDDDANALTLQTSKGQMITLDDSGTGSITLSGGERKIEMSGGTVKFT
jgi:uncharacterized protein involved in type VI secretion and phage assembly